MDLCIPACKQAPGLQPPLNHPGVCGYVHTYVCCVYTYVRMYCSCCTFGHIVVLHDLGFELVKHSGWPFDL